MMKQTLGVSLVVALAGCGGGDGDSITQHSPISDAAGFYARSAATSTDQDQFTMIFEDGSYYILSTGDNLGDATMIVGKSGQILNGSISSTDGRRYDANPAVPVTVSASYLSKRSISGTATSTSPAKTTTFNGTYDASYDRTPQLSTTAGTYSGITGSRLFLENATIVINAAGSFTGTGQSGCRLTGTLKPKSRGNAFDLTYTFGASPCAAANQTFTGVALAEDGELLAITTSADRQNAVLFAGARN